MFDHVMRTQTNESSRTLQGVMKHQTEKHSVEVAPFEPLLQQRSPAFVSPLESLIKLQRVVNDEKLTPDQVVNLIDTRKDFKYWSKRIGEENVAKIQDEFKQLSFRGIISQNRMLEYFGLEEFLHTALADRLFKFFLTPSADPIATKLGVSPADKDKPLGVRLMDWHAFFMLMVVVLHGTSEEKCELVCMLFDENRDGWLDREELTTILIRLLNLSLSAPKAAQETELAVKLRDLGLGLSPTERNNLVLTFVVDLFKEYALKDSTQIENPEMYQFLQDRILQH